jgi:signal transduction histidine kinase
VLPLRRALYLLLSFALGTTWFVVLVTGISAGIGMAISLVGIPLLVAMLWVVRWMAQLERSLVRRLIGVDAAAHYRRADRPGIWAAIPVRLGDPQTWKDLVYLIVQFPLGIVWFAIAAALISASLGTLLAPVYYWAVPDGIDVGLFRADTLPEAIALVPVGALLSWLSWHVLDRLGRLHGWWARLILASTPDPELTARVDEMRSSQARIIEAADDARRRIERDLHDGAQQRLVALSLKLGMARKRLPTDDAAARLVAEAHEESKLALGELRDLARGIHPAILTERGLGPALEELATRAAVPVVVEEVPEQRLAPVPEAAAYFVVAECLANVAKYARAGEVRVRARREVGRIVVEVVDDGVGGADPEKGSGLRGLADRVEALGGALTLRSVTGHGTAVRAEIPIVAAAMARDGSPA